VEHYREEHGLDTEAITEAEAAVSEDYNANSRPKPEPESPKE